MSYVAGMRFFVTVATAMALVSVLAACRPRPAAEEQLPEAPASSPQGAASAPRGDETVQRRDSATRRGKHLSTERTDVVEPLSPEAAAVDRITSIVRDTMRVGPTLVVWLVDSSPSARRWDPDLLDAIEAFYEQLPQESSVDQSPQLVSAVLAFGQQLKWVIETPTADHRAVADALCRCPLDPTGRERTFAAIKLALDRFLDVRRKREREVVFVIVSDEAGDDAERVDEMVDAPQRFALPIYVLGVPAPFGRTAALDDDVERQPVSGTGDAPGAVLIRQGPESRRLERIPLELWEPDDELELMDSGFGPFALERLCRASGGAFIAIRPPADASRLDVAFRRSWPGPRTLQFSPEVLRRYPPDYLSADEYRAVLASNRACQALHDASLRAPTPTMRRPELEFERGGDAELKRALDRAQQAAAKVEPGIDSVYEALRKGVDDRERLTRPRWQAGYDLAMGCASAAKVRVEGYNEMLAALKRGRRFENASSRYWVLEPSNKAPSSSVLAGLADRARMYLERVVHDHPGTPWARIADHELQSPLGWRWTER